MVAAAPPAVKRLVTNLAHLLPQQVDNTPLTRLLLSTLSALAMACPASKLGLFRPLVNPSTSHVISKLGRWGFYQSSECINHAHPSP